MKTTIFTLSLLFTLVLFSCNSNTGNKIESDGPEVVDFNVLPFEIKDVKLLDGPFKRATELNIESLLNYEPDRLLARFREQAGLEPKAEHYHGWEAQSLAGHSLGHYLSGCALMFQTTGNEEFLNRVNYIVDELELVQQADGDGYLGAFDDGKRIFEQEVAKGIIVSAPFSLNGIWAPFYTHHKVLAGLRDAYSLCGNQKALAIQIAFSDWIYDIVAGLTSDQIQQMLVCEVGGINEVFAELYGFTGEKRYLELSRIFHDDIVLGKLEQQVDILPGNHANTQIPKITGLARRYELTGDMTDKNAAFFFWNTVINDHTYVTGGNCNEEYFGEAGKLRDRLGPNTTETCNVYNMLRLTKHLFQWDANSRMADYYERALINHIHSSQHPVDGRVIYNLNLDMGGQKQFQNPLGFTCCVGSGMETHSKYSEAIYFQNHKELYVSQFIASELNWEAMGVVLQQHTAFPEEEGTRFEFQCVEPVTFSLQIRYPHWAEEGLEISVNGKPVKIAQNPGQFIPVNRKWRSGDTVVVKFPFNLRLEHMPDDENRVSIFNGPVLLAGDLGPGMTPGSGESESVPVLLTLDRNPAHWTNKLPGLHQFVTQAGQPENVELKPFYSFTDRRYTIFWDMLTQEQLAQKNLKIEKQIEFEKNLYAFSAGKVSVGNSYEEKLSNFKGEKSSLRYYKNRLCREADRDGWFSYELPIAQGEPASLVIEYWGGFEGSRTFDILVEGIRIATENISSKKDGHFLHVAYPIPFDLAGNKESVLVEFRPHDFNRAGPIFGLYTIKTRQLQSLGHVN